jgi:di/tricarboxylate transporter
MTPQIAMTLVIVGVAVFLFATERLPVDVVALGVLISLILTGLLPSEEAFAGFGSDTVILTLGLLIMTSALEKTGIIELTGRAIMKRVGDKPNRLRAVVQVAVAVLSAFISNTAATAFFVPMVIGVAQRARVSASKLLMPLAFASILTSAVTLISTSTNIVVSGLMTRYGLEPLGMFEMTPIGLPIAIAGLLYMYFIGHRLIPARAPAGGLLESWSNRLYMTEVLIVPESPLAGKTLAEANLRRDLDLTIINVVRDKTRYITPYGGLVLKEGDILLAEGNREEILKIRDVPGIEIKAEVKLSDPELAPQDMNLAEVIIMPRSPLLGRSLKGRRFRQTYGLQVLAIERRGAPLREKLSTARLQLGDVLLVQGDRDHILRLEQDAAFRLITEIEGGSANRRQAGATAAIFTVAIGAAVFGLLPLGVAALTGAVVVFIVRAITPEEAYRVVDWRIIILLGCMLALGRAMELTGTAAFIAEQIVSVIGSTSPLILLGGFFILTLILTQPMSNQAAAAVVLPVALQTATQLGLEPRSFAMMIVMAASCSFITPLEPSCLLVYGPGQYKFFDFVKVGLPLTVIIFIISLVMVPMLYPPG